MSVVFLTTETHCYLPLPSLMVFSVCVFCLSVCLSDVLAEQENESVGGKRSQQMCENMLLSFKFLFSLTVLMRGTDVMYRK